MSVQLKTLQARQSFDSALKSSGIRVGHADLVRASLNGVYVLTNGMIEAAHCLPAQTAYSRIRHTLTEGVHFYRLDGATAARAGIPAPCVKFDGPVTVKRGARAALFYTAEGYARIANSFQGPKHQQIMADMLRKYFDVPVEGTRTPHVLAKSFNGTAFEFREDGYFNMTKAAKAYGKHMDNFWALKSTKPYLAALSKSLEIGELEIVEQHRGHYGGTWAHPKLAVFFARWLDVEFAVWCDMVIDSLLRGQTTINIQVDTPAEVLQVPETAGTLRASATYAANMELRKELEVAKEGARTLQERVEHLETAIRNRDDAAAWNAKLIAAAHGELKRLQELESRVKAVRGLLVAIGETVKLQ